MRWTERQRAMLREMGVRLWLPEQAPAREREPAPAVAVVSFEEARAGDGHVARTPESTGSLPGARLRDAPPRRDEPARVPGLAPADWLVVGDPLDAADPQQEQLLEHML